MLVPGQRCSALRRPAAAGSLLAVAAGIAAAAAVVLTATPMALVARQAAIERALSAASAADR